MVSDSITREIGTVAWSQLVLSIISNSPPSDMSRNYYNSYPENYSGKQLKRLEIYKYKLGTKNIQTRMRYNMPFVQANERETQQGIEHIRDRARSIKYSELLHEDEDDNHQGIGHLRSCLISSKHSDVVQINEDENQQGIEHVRESLRSSKHSKVVQENEDEYEQGIEHIRDSQRSSKHYEVVPGHKDENHQGIDHSSFLMNSESVLSSKHFEVVQEHEDKNLHGMEYFQECPRFSKVPKVVQNQQEIKQDTSRLNMHIELEQAEEHGNQIKHIRDSIKSTVSFKPAEFDDRELINKFRQTVGSTELPEDADQPLKINYKEARQMSTLFDELLDLIENENLVREEKPTVRFQVLKVMKLLHHYGLDTIQRGVEKELEDVNLKCIETEEDMAIYHKKKGLEIMLRICSTETCQTIIYDIIGKAERHQVFFI